MNPVKIVYILLGTISLSLGTLGIIVPGLPTTPFVLLSAALYLKSSDRLYKKLLNHKIYGKIIGDFTSGKSWTFKAKFLSITLMLFMVMSSIIFFVHNTAARIIIAAAGLAGFITMILIPVRKTDI